jgi:hypothetical protein
MLGMKAARASYATIIRRGYNNLEMVPYGAPYELKSHDVHRAHGNKQTEAKLSELRVLLEAIPARQYSVAVDEFLSRLKNESFE